MLTRRIFRQLTDSVLHGVPIALPCVRAIRCAGRNDVSRDPTPLSQARHSSSSTRWKSRQGSDRYASEAKVQGLKSRAAFKLLEIDQKHRLFKPGQTVVDLGYAPGSWSQVAQTKTLPNGRVIGIDILPVQPPAGVSTIQGNFLSPEIQAEVRAYVQEPTLGRLKKRFISERDSSDDEDPEPLIPSGHDYLNSERHTDLDFSHREEALVSPRITLEMPQKISLKQRDQALGRVVDVLLSDMSAPWAQTTGMWVKSVSNPYHRMMNTSGIPFKDHSGSMDLCFAALTFAFDTLRTGGAFVCKFYQGGEDKEYEGRLKRLFERVVREKPESSRSESKEAFFIALRRRENVAREDVLG